MTRIAGIPVVVEITERMNAEGTYKYLVIEDSFSGSYISEPMINGWDNKKVVAEDITRTMWDSYRTAVGKNTIPAASPYETIEELEAHIDENYFDYAWRERERVGDMSILDYVKKYGPGSWLLSSSVNDSPASK